MANQDMKIECQLAGFSAAASAMANDDDTGSRKADPFAAVNDAALAAVLVGSAHCTIKVAFKLNESTVEREFVLQMQACPVEVGPQSQP